MKLSLIPKTILGKWAVGLIITFFLLFALSQLSIARLVASGQGGGETFFSRPVPAILLLLSAISASSAFFTGIISIVKHKERSILVFISTAIGLFVLWFSLGEILVPH